MASHEMWLEQFRGYFRSRARKALKGDDTYEWPFVMARPLEDPDSDEFAEFAAGFLSKPMPSSPAEPWCVRGILCRNPKGPPIVAELIVEHFRIDEDGARAEVTGTLLRDLSLATIRDDALAKLPWIQLGREAMAEDDSWGVTAEEVEQARRAAREAAKRKRGRPGHPDEHYRRIALRYLELVERHRNVLVVLAAEESERLGRKVPRETVRDWVRKATEPERGYLAPGKPGRAEVRPGPNLYPKEK